MRPERPDTWTVTAPGRLHLGFLDPAGSLGRRFGSVGLVIDGYATEIEVAPASRDEVVAQVDAARSEVDRVAAHLAALRQRTGRHEALSVRLHQVLPAHAGFGSGTQLALAVGRAFAAWHDLDVGAATLAQWLGRGLRSGVGIAGFDQGGLLVDGGPGSDGRPAPLLARLELPEAWRVIVVEDPRQHGLCGAAERQALAALSPLPRSASADVCHQVLMRLLPGAAAGDFALFAGGLTSMQQTLGDHFAPAQGGCAYTSPAVGRFVAAVARLARGGAGVGQSSWGPTGFAVVASQAVAEAAVEAARAQGEQAPELQVRIVAPRHRGAVVHGQPLARLAMADAASPCIG